MLYMNEAPLDIPPAREQWDKLSKKDKEILAIEQELIAARMEKENLLAKISVVDAKISVAIMKLESRGEEVSYYKNNPV